MFERFGEFGSVEELNRAAAAQKSEGDGEALVLLALENGIDREDAEDYMDGLTEELATPLMAALGKLKVETAELGLEGILADWKETVEEMCIEDTQMQEAVRSKGKCLRDCMAALIRFAFENKVQVSEKIVRVTKVTHNGREEQMRSPLYLGIPGRSQVKQLAGQYYMK